MNIANYVLPVTAGIWNESTKKGVEEKCNRIVKTANIILSEQRNVSKIDGVIYTNATIEKPMGENATAAYWV